MRAVLWQLLADETGQDFLEYAILGGAIVAVAGAVIYAFRNELINTFNCMVAQMRGVRNTGGMTTSC